MHTILISAAVLLYCAAAAFVARWFDGRADHYPDIETLRDHAGFRP